MTGEVLVADGHPGNFIEQHHDGVPHRQLAGQKLECRGPTIQNDTRGRRLVWRVDLVPEIVLIICAPNQYAVDLVPKKLSLPPKVGNAAEDGVERGI